MEKITIPIRQPEQTGSLGSSKDWIFQPSILIPRIEPISKIKAPTYQRVIIFFIFATTIFLTFLGFINSMPLILAIFTDLTLLTISYYIVVTHYKSTPEAKRKKELVLGLDNLNKEVKKAAQSLETLASKKLFINEEETKKYAAIDRGFDSSSNNCKNEIKRIEDDFLHKLSEINRQRQIAEQNASKDAQNSLSKIQSDSISNTLKRSELLSSQIPGIGAELKKSLYREGIRTAADFVNLRITSSNYYRHQTSFVSLVLSNGRTVHVTGIGPQKGQALLNWRKSIESKISAIPKALPYPEQQRINIQKQNKLKDLTEREYKSKQDRIVKRNKAISSCKSEHEKLKIQLRNTKDHYDSNYRIIEKEISDCRNHLSTIRFNIVSQNAHIEAYKNIKLQTYIKTVFGVNP